MKLLAKWFCWEMGNLLNNLQVCKVVCNKTENRLTDQECKIILFILFSTTSVENWSTNSFLYLIFTMKFSFLWTQIKNCRTIWHCPNGWRISETFYQFRGIFNMYDRKLPNLLKTWARSVWKLEKAPTTSFIPNFPSWQNILNWHCWTIMITSSPSYLKSFWCFFENSVCCSAEKHKSTHDDCM